MDATQIRYVYVLIYIIFYTSMYMYIMIYGWQKETPSIDSLHNTKNRVL